MKHLPLFILSLVLLVNLGCVNNYPNEMPNPYSDYETDTVRWKKWVEGVDNYLDDVAERDSVILLTDYGEPLPYDVYKECCYYYGHKPECTASLSQIIGEWECRGREAGIILKLTNRGDYNVVMDDDSPNRTIRYDKSGMFIYDSAFNRITLLDFYTAEELPSVAYNHYENPQNEDLIITDVSDFSMDLFGGGAYDYYFLRRGIMDLLTLNRKNKF